MTTTASLYEELGGAAAIEAALDVFYEKVMADPRVSIFFDGVDVQRVKDKQKAFMTIALGGESDYDGRGLRAAHARARARGLDGERFDTFVGHFSDTLAELGVDEPKIEQVMEIVYGGRDHVLGRGGQA